MFNFKLINKISGYPAYTCSKEKNIRKSSDIHDFKNFDNFLPDNLHELTSINWINFHGKSIQKNVIVVLFDENGPQFNLVSQIIKTSKNDIIVLAYELQDCFLDAHYSAYKVYDVTKRKCKTLDENDMEYCTITHIMFQSSGFYYIQKNWM